MLPDYARGWFRSPSPPPSVPRLVEDNYLHSNENARVELWITKVAETTRQNPRYDLRAQPKKRKALEEIRSTANELNQRPDTGEVLLDSKRRKMEHQRNVQTGKKSRGRPPKVQPNDPFNNVPQLPPTPKPASSSSVNRSPRRGAPSKAADRSDRSIDVGFLRFCSPTINLVDFETASEQGIIPENAKALWAKIDQDPGGCIPSELKDQYSASNPSPNKYGDRAFMPSTPYPGHRLASLAECVEGVKNAARRCHRLNAHEREWGASVVSRLLRELSELRDGGQRWTIMNIENCGLGPVELLPAKPDHMRLLSQHINPTTESQSSNSEEVFSRMIDWSCHIILGYPDEKLLVETYSEKPDNLRSVNQSLSWIRDLPIFLNIEIKMSNSTRVPFVQLAVWESAALKKKQEMQWNPSIPTPAISVQGHDWKLYLFFEDTHDLVALGPMSLGNTSNTRAIWALMYRLHIIVQWGQTEYTQWFMKEVLGKQPIATGA